MDESGELAVADTEKNLLQDQFAAGARAPIRHADLEPVHSRADLGG